MLKDLSFFLSRCAKLIIISDLESSTKVVTGFSYQIVYYYVNFYASNLYSKVSDSNRCLVYKMTEQLSEAMRSLALISEDEKSSFDNIDAMFGEHRPRKRQKKTLAEMKKDLEELYLTPPTSLGSEWLNRLQQ